MKIASLIFSALISLLPIAVFVAPNWRAIYHNVIQRNFRELPPTILGFLVGTGVSSIPWFMFFPEQTWTIVTVLGVFMAGNGVAIGYLLNKHRPIAKQNNSQISQPPSLPKRAKIIPLNQTFSSTSSTTSHIDSFAQHSHSVTPIDGGHNQGNVQDDVDLMRLLSKQADLEQEARFLWVEYTLKGQDYFWPRYEKLLQKAIDLDKPKNFAQSQKSYQTPSPISLTIEEIKALEQEAYQLWQDFVLENNQEFWEAYEALLTKVHFRG